MSADKHYEIRIAGSQVLLRVAPPDKAGRAAMGDIQRDLQELGVKFMPENLFEVYRRTSNAFEPVGIRESKEYTVMVDVTPDAMEAYLTIYPPDVPGATLHPNQVRDALEAAKVEKGVLYDVIRTMLAEHTVGKRTLVARGQAPVHGEDGRIEFYVAESKGSTVDANRVDFKELNLIDNVEEGDVIAHLLPPSQPEDGFNVLGRILPGRVGAKAKMKAGKNVRRSEEGTELIAKKSGFIVVSGDKISVEDIMRVKDVDAETGNLHFTGVVQITGQVQDGYAVQADRGIQVSGTVGRATLKCGGDIRVNGGVIGAKIEASGNVYARFFNEATVEAGKDVIANEYILHSHVLAHQNIIVEKMPSGFITGGLVQAGISVTSPNLGSDVSEEKTQVEVGTGFGMRQRFDAMERKMKLERASFEKISRQLLLLQSQKEQQRGLPKDKVLSLQKMSRTAQAFRAELLSQLHPFHELRREMEVNDDAPAEPAVFVEKIVNPGTTIQLQRHRVTIKTPLEYSAFRIIKSEIKAQDFKEGQRAHKMHLKVRSEQQAQAD